VDDNDDGNEGLISRPLGGGLMARCDGFEVTLEMGQISIVMTTNELVNFLEFIAEMKREFDL